MLEAKTAKKAPPRNANDWSFGEWRPEPPRSLFLRLLSVGKPMDLCYGLVVLSTFLVSLSLFGSGSSFWLAVAAMVICMLLWGYTRAKGWTNESIRDLMDIPATIAQYPVDATFLSNGAQYGSDKGIVSFVDGMMHFQGFRSSFNFPVDRAKLEKLQQSEARIMATSIYNIPWYEHGFFGVVRLKAIDAVPGVGDGFATKFWFAYSDWSADRVSAPGPCLLPPRTPQPQSIEKYVIELVTSSLVVLLVTAGLWLGLRPLLSPLSFVMVAALATRIGYGFLKIPARSVLALKRMKNRPCSATEILEDAPDGSIHQLGAGYAASHSLPEEEVKA